MGLLRLLLENIVPDTPEMIKKLINKRAIKQIRSKYYEQSGEVMSKEKAIEAHANQLKYRSLDNLIDHIFEADPSDGNKYIKWILSNYVYPKIDKNPFDFITKFVEDFYKLEHYLHEFHNKKIEIKRIDHSIDINDYNSIQDLYQVISKVEDPKPTEKDYTVEDVMENDYYIKNDQADLIFRDSESMVVVPKTFEASQFYGCTTEWCTTYPDSFEIYTKDGILIIFVKKEYSETRKGRAQLALDYGREDAIEFRYADDVWVEAPFSYIRLEEAKAIKEYLLNDPKYTYEDTPLKHDDKKYIDKRDGYDIIKKGNEYYIRFKDWIDLSHILGKQEWLGKEVFGDGHFDSYFFSYDEIDWSYRLDIDKTTIEEIKNRIKELFEEKAYDDDPEFFDMVDEIEDDEDLHEILEQRISLDYEDIWDEIAFSLSIAYTDAQGSADYNEAFEQLTDHIAYQLGMDLDKGIKWDGNYMVVPLERGHEPSGDESDVKYELSQVMDIDYLQADYEEPEYETYHQPRYGFQGTIDEEHLNELIRERLYL